MKAPLRVMHLRKIEEKEYEGKCLLLVIYPAFADFMPSNEILLCFPWHRICARSSSSWKGCGVLGRTRERDAGAF